MSDRKGAADRSRTGLQIEWLEMADSPSLWRSLGFDVDDQGHCIVGGVEHRLMGTTDGAAAGLNDAGLLGWAVSGIDPAVRSIDGIPTKVVDEGDAHPRNEHPNHVFRIDHLVIRTSSTPRAIAAFADVGLSNRGGRDSTSSGAHVDMTFFWAGDTLLELVGPASPEPGGHPSAFSGIAYSSADLDATVAVLGDRSTTPVDAVQPGRRIAALTPDAGSSIPMAFMTPHVRTSSS